MGSILKGIQQKINYLSEAERKIGNFILQYPDLVPNMTTKDMSKKTGSSEATVVRFCKSVGIESFKTLKLELVRELSQADRQLTDFSILETKGEPFDFFQQVVHVNKMAIESMLSSIDRKALDKAVNLLQQANQILFFGVGGSSTAAYDGYYKFTRLGYACTAPQDFHLMLSTIPYLKKTDVLIAISMSGKTKDVVDLAEVAKRSGVTVIAITNLDKSPLYKVADIHLCTPTVEHDFRIGSIPSRMTQLTVIDALYLSIFHSKGDQILSKYQDARKEVERLRR